MRTEKSPRCEQRKRPHPEAAPTRPPDAAAARTRQRRTEVDAAAEEGRPRGRGSARRRASPRTELSALLTHAVDNTPPKPPNPSATPFKQLLPDTLRTETPLPVARRSAPAPLCGDTMGVFAHMGHEVGVNWFSYYVSFLCISGRNLFRAGIPRRILPAAAPVGPARPAGVPVRMPIRRTGPRYRASRSTACSRDRDAAARQRMAVRQTRMSGAGLSESV